jgi:hypothetical protein
MKKCFMCGTTAEVNFMCKVGSKGWIYLCAPHSRDCCEPLAEEANA